MIASARHFYDRAKILEPRLTFWLDLFVYHLTVEMGQQAATLDAVKACYLACDVSPPSWLASYLSRGVREGRFVKTKHGYRLDARHHEAIAEMLGARPVAPVQVSRSLSSLEPIVPAGAKRDFLHETIICYEVGANRAAVVMCWNLALHHLQDYVLSDAKRLSDFNAALALNKDGRVKIKVVTKQDDFTEMPESKFILFCREAKLITGSVFNKLDGRLDERNAAAHPSGVKVTPKAAEAFIEDLVENIVLKYPAT